MAKRGFVPAKKEQDCFFCDFIRNYPELAKALNFDNIQSRDQINSLIGSGAILGGN